MNAETARRRNPRPETLRELFLKSGNLCSYPDCGRLMMNATGDFVGQICHIEAAVKGGERFNQSMTNEQRRDVSNLMLMCYDHHVITDDVAVYTVEKLQGFKKDHERRFSRPDRAILAQLVDATTLDQPTRVLTLTRVSTLLGWSLGPDEIAHSCALLNAFADRFQRVPEEVRAFIGAVAMRMNRMADTDVVVTGRAGGGSLILLSDIKGALRLTDDALWELGGQVEQYDVGWITEIETDLGKSPALLLKDLDGWDFWPDLARFCELGAVPMDAFCLDLDFGRLD